MAEFVAQGEINVLGTTLYTGSNGAVLTKVITLRFYNALAYTLRLERYSALTTNSEVIYDLTLSAGDSVSDTFSYALNSGDQLIVYTNIPGTTYYVYGIDYV